MELHQIARNGESQARPAATPFGAPVHLNKGIEDPFQVFRGNADSGIADGNFYTGIPPGIKRADSAMLPAWVNFSALLTRFWRI